MLLFALVFGQMARKLRQPQVLGEILGGIILGPTVCGAVLPGAYAWLFPKEGTVLICREALIQLGMLFFLFVAGLETNLEHLRRRQLSVALTGIAAVVVPFGLGLGMVYVLPGMWGFQIQSRFLTFAVFMGAALSISALPVIARILIDLDLLKKEFGAMVMAAATINDLIGWTIFAALVSGFAPSSGGDEGWWVTLVTLLIFTGLILTVGRWAGQHALRWLQPRLSWRPLHIGVMTVLVLMTAVVSQSIGIHAIFGAFLLGVALARTSGERYHAHEVVYQFALSFFAPLFFVSIGLKADFAVNFDLLLVLLILVVACAGKVGGAGLAAWASGMPRKEALAFGFGMNARGAMEIILASLALQYRFIDERLFVALVVMALVTSMLSAPVMQRLLTIKPRNNTQKTLSPKNGHD
jgi:Kef-type K+ transport system membrane component KefB